MHRLWLNCGRKVTFVGSLGFTGHGSTEDITKPAMAALISHQARAAGAEALEEAFRQWLGDLRALQEATGAGGVMRCWPKASSHLDETCFFEDSEKRSLGMSWPS